MENFIKVKVIESEKGWGQKVDDYMVCLTEEDANEFNALNGHEVVPDWYMYATNDYGVIKLGEPQLSYLKENKRVWLSKLNNL